MKNAGMKFPQTMGVVLYVDQIMPDSKLTQI